jgi:heptose I phosphotransferase
VGWGEILKNLVTLRPPVVSARNEYEACRRLADSGVRAPGVAAFGERGANPARRESFVVCDAIEGAVSLEDFTADWIRLPPASADLRRLVVAVAEFARRFHDAGLVHRDFYLCHLLLDHAAWRTGRVELAVLDLHRARIFANLPARWRQRDLAALLFSTLDLPITRRSWYRFVRIYTGRPLREVFAADAGFWRQVERRARALYRKGLRKGIVRGIYRP